VGTWIRANTSGRHFRITYDELKQSDSQLQNLLHELYEEQADIACMCQDKPVPMHIRRIRLRPRAYCLVTNKHYEHAESCPRNGKAIRVPTPVLPPSTQIDGSSSIASNYHIQISKMAEGDLSTPSSDVDRFEPQRGMWVPSLEQLNSAQREAATHKEGPCIVVAAAGSGKTAMLIERIKFLVDSGVQPDRILACTFTRKAADEMKARLVHRLGETGKQGNRETGKQGNRETGKQGNRETGKQGNRETGKQVTIGTIHSVAYRMVMPQMGDEWDVIPEPSWLIEQVLERAGSHNPHGVGNILPPSEAIFGVYRAKSDALWPMQVDGPLGKVYKAYENVKTERKKLDFEDLLLHAVRLFQTRPDFAEQWQTRFDYVLVDEFQDVNQVQWVFLCELVKRTRNICVVGDDWQSIYGFRGARPELMSAFIRQFPDAKRVVLSTNYRPNDLIIELGNRVIALNRGYQIEKQVRASRGISESAVVQVVTVKTDVEEAGFVANEIKQHREQFPNIPYNEFAVLYRTNIQSRVYEEALAEQEIPFQIIGDTHFYESHTVKVILDYLRTACDKSDPALWGPLINRPKRFVPNAVVREVQEGGWETAQNHLKCQAFVKTIQQLEEHTLPADAIRWLLESVSGLVKSHDDSEPIKWVDSLIQSASLFETVPEFLKYVDWVIERSKTSKQDAVQLMTIHRSKGLEFETVFVAGLAEGLLPYKKSLDENGIREETRLCYVAITRARENLYLLSSEIYSGKTFELSRFIKILQS